MLDKERKDWYNQQIDDQESVVSLPIEDQSVVAKVSKKFDMFDEDSDSDNDQKIENLS